MSAAEQIAGVFDIDVPAVEEYFRQSEALTVARVASRE